MPKIKELSKYNGSSWETGVPIGADASNVDVTVSGGSTKSLQTVLGTPSNSTDLQTQINSKVGTTGDGSSTTVTGISNYDTDSGETSKDLVTDVVASNSNSQATLWSKFNRFRRRVNNKFGDYFANANLVTSTTGVTTSGTDSEAYTAKALNDYFANVIGYASESDLPSSADTVASQLSSLNNNTKLSTTSIGSVITKSSGATSWTLTGTYTLPKKGLYLFIATGVYRSGRPNGIKCTINNGEIIYMEVSATGDQDWLHLSSIPSICSCAKNDIFKIYGRLKDTSGMVDAHASCSYLGSV